MTIYRELLRFLLSNRALGRCATEVGGHHQGDPSLRHAYSFTEVIVVGLPTCLHLKGIIV